MGKGSNRRTEDTQKVRDNWDIIFGKKKEKEQKSQENTNSQKTK